MMVFLSHNGTPINGANHHVTPSVGVPVVINLTLGAIGCTNELGAEGSFHGVEGDEPGDD